MAEKRTVYFVAAFVSVACCASAESDLDEYVASIKRTGMSERAAGDVRTVANILSGGTIFQARPSPDGSIGRFYGGPLESGLGWSERQAILRERAVSREAWAEFLKDHADTDGSGFVNTNEGAALRRRVETALIAAQIRPDNVEQLYGAVPEASKVEADLAAYSAMRAEALTQGLEGMPPVPKGLDITPR